MRKSKVTIGVMLVLLLTAVMVLTGCGPSGDTILAGQTFKISDTDSLTFNEDGLTVSYTISGITQQTGNYTYDTDKKIAAITPTKVNLMYMTGSESDNNLLGKSDFIDAYVEMAKKQGMTDEAVAQMVALVIESGDVTESEVGHIDTVKEYVEYMINEYGVFDTRSFNVTLGLDGKITKMVEIES
jgi:hypothetical protein